MTIKNCKVNDCHKRELLGEIERLRMALARIAGCREYDPMPDDADHMARIAKDALDAAE